MFHSAAGIFVAMVNSPPQEFHVAPMQCYTNQPLRKLYRFLSSSSTLYSEMEKVDDMLQNIDEALHKRLYGEQDDTNLILQLGSNDPNKLDRCVRAASLCFPNLKEINLNCGCPAIDTGGAATYGASLMKDTSLTSNLVKSMSSATDIDISVKCRIGVFETAEYLRPLNEEDYQYLSNYISEIHNAGAKHVVLHARPAILSMSPVKNRNIPTLDYDFVNQIATDFDGRVKVTMNGGINSLDQLYSFQNDKTSTINSYMSGRWCLRRPLDLVAIEQTLGNGIRMDPHKAIDKYIDYALQSSFPISELCLPLYLVVEQLREDYEQEEEGDLLSWEDMEDLYDIIQDGLKELGSGKVKTSSSVNFKRLASSFKSVVGTKVVNKWKRNRSEL